MPGETPDQMVVWMPEQKVLLAADNIYQSFPNLYAIRGTSPRDVNIWAETIYKMAELRAHYLVPSHTRPVEGEETIYDLLMKYGNGIQYVHDQAVRSINKLVHPDEAAQAVKLPKSLASHPFLQEFYGTVGWSVKAVYTQYIGWFNGDPVELNPLSPKERAKKMVQMVGVDGLLDNARAALQNGEHQWALELASHVLKARPVNAEAKKVRLEAFRKLASKQTSANGRHYYLTASLEDFDRLDIKMELTKNVLITPIATIFRFMKSKLRAEDVEGKKSVLCFNFTDTNEHFVLKLENSVLRVLEVESFPENPDVLIITTTMTWKDIILQRISALRAYMSGDMVVQGSMLELRNFMSYFERPN